MEQVTEVEGAGAWNFPALIKAEETLIRDPGAPAPTVELEQAAGEGTDAITAPPGSADEPWVAFAEEDRVGLAFSGGGIRSATFNLGVLQGLQRLKLLRHFHYLATVSGGGYVGAWWSVWLSRRPKGAGLFPGHDEDGDRDVKSGAGKEETREPEEVRHLREFSNFLSPRLGFFESEMWAAVLAVLSAMLPALTVAIAVLVAGLLLWLLLAALLTIPYAPVAGIGAGILTTVVIFVTQWSTEKAWCAKRKAETCQFPVPFWPVLAICGVIATVGAWVLIGRCGWLETPSFSSAPGTMWWPTETGGLWPGFSKVWTGFGIDSHKPGQFSFNPGIFHAPLAWLLTALVLLVPRIIVFRLKGENKKWRVYIATADRVLQRLLAASVVWTALAGIWLAGAWLHQTKWGTSSATAGAMLTGGVFSMLRNWMASQLTSSRKSGMLEQLKPLLPQLLAYLALLLGAIGVAAGVATGLDHWQGWPFWLGALAVATGVLAFAVFGFDPALVSMHAFYRNRLARAYLGASNRDPKPDDEPDAAGNRFIDLRENDDRRLFHLADSRAKRHPGPLHLVCCAANDLGGDTLGSLARGARSAVLSPVGFSIGNHWRPWNLGAKDSVSVASAITASAAAFNSNMGSLSMSLGPAVAFLMSALNLRLGLWLKHPLLPDSDLGRSRGMLFLREMFQSTRCAVEKDASGKEQPVSEYVHLSDGAHFENLALYELVRRHCRYILVSDCGADPEVAFDDFGNAMRRIREDFGIEIDIDVSPLKPDGGHGLSRQHMVVGTIYYDRERSDTGILLYIKPTLTGDEPCDVTQYRTRNGAFPHEGTGDQFYDEAQWESYRRLGEHAIHSGLRFLERSAKAARKGLDEIPAREAFAGAQQEWYQAPPDLAHSAVQAADRIVKLEERLRANDSVTLRHEIFPELNEFAKSLRKKNSAAAKAPAAAKHPTAAELEQNLPTILDMFRIMEDIWLTCHLDTHWNHPMNMGLLNLLQRWAYAPSCRLWWPFLRPLHGSGFRRFMEEHLSLSDPDHPETTAKARRHAPVGGQPDSDAMPRGLAHLHWQRSRHRVPDVGADETPLYYEYMLFVQLQQDGSDQLIQIEAQIGLAFVRETAGAVARMRTEDFFVPPSLWGTGLGGGFLKELLYELPGTVEQFEVELPASKVQLRDPASRRERTDMISFYKRAGFRAEIGGEKLVAQRTLAWTRPKPNDATVTGGSPLPS